MHASLRSTLSFCPNLHCSPCRWTIHSSGRPSWCKYSSFHRLSKIQSRKSRSAWLSWAKKRQSWRRKSPNRPHCSFKQLRAPLLHQQWKALKSRLCSESAPSASQSSILCKKASRTGQIGSEKHVFPSKSGKRTREFVKGWKIAVKTRLCKRKCLTKLLY